MATTPKTTTRCAIPNCRSNVTSNEQIHNDISLFKVPTYPAELSRWSTAVAVTGKHLNRFDSLCERHFEQRFIVRSFRTKLNGKNVEIEPEVQLAADALPTIFETLPKRVKRSYKRRIAHPPVTPTPGRRSDRINKKMLNYAAERLVEEAMRENKFVIKEECNESISGNLDLAETTPDTLTTKTELAEFISDDSDAADGEFDVKREPETSPLDIAKSDDFRSEWLPSISAVTSLSTNRLATHKTELAAAEDGNGIASENNNNVHHVPVSESLHPSLPTESRKTKISADASTSDFERLKRNIKNSLVGNIDDILNGKLGTSTDKISLHLAEKFPELPLECILSFVVGVISTARCVRNRLFTCDGDSSTDDEAREKFDDLLTSSEPDIDVNIKCF